MQTVIANRRDFFPENSCPVALRAIHGDAVKQHAGDLTDVRHTHDFAELIIITRGGGEHWINGDVYPVSAGDVFLIQGRTEHYFTRRHDLEMYNIMFDERYLREHLENLRTLPGFNAFFLFEPTYRRRHKFKSRLHLEKEPLFPLESLLRQTEDEKKRDLPGSDLLLLSRLLEIFVVISREYSRNRNPMARSLVRLGNLISRLENEYAKDWSIGRISAITAMAPSTLLPIFKTVTGHSPIDYLLNVRLCKAAGMLTDSSDNVSAIAEKCGFRDSNYFSRQFRKKYLCSPREYRIKATRNA
ncbi:MAG: helix-turn-helix domain-containing protein [Victivallaceae bacterium]|nr:helix-turn-helix domain-containing protein [Victivallaceae bacterium]